MYRIVVSVFQPLTFGFLCALLLTAMLWRKRGTGRKRMWCLSVVLVVLALACTELVGYPAIRSLEWLVPPQGELSRRPDVIVVLSGGVWPRDPEHEHVELDTPSMSRCARAVELYRQTGPCLVLCTGGKVNPTDPGPPTARAMRDFLVEMGIPASDVLVEDTSHSTYENATHSRRIITERKLDRVVLVTDAAHMARAVWCFRALGVEVTPAACRYRAVWFNWSASSLLPNPRSAYKVHDALHEWLGLAWYWLRGRI